MKVSYALEFHADLDLKKAVDGFAKLRGNMDPFAPFIKRLKSELQGIKDGDIIDVPNIPLCVYESTNYDALKQVCPVVESFPWLRQLSFLHCKIGDEGAMVIADFLKSYRPHAEQNPFGIEVLELPDNAIGPKGAIFLGRMLAQNESIKTLNVDFNPFGDEGAANFGDGMKWNSTVEKLSMQYCAIGAVGGECVAKHLVRSSSVKDLSLRGNPLGSHGVREIALSLAKNAFLTRLDLADTSFGIDLESIEALRDGIESNNSLEAIDLNLNSMVPAGVQLLQEVLKSKPKITSMHVSERISDVVFKDVLDTMNANLKLMKKKKKKAR